MTLNRMSKLYLHSWVTEFVTVLNSMLFDLNIHKLNHNWVTSSKNFLCHIYKEFHYIMPSIKVNSSFNSFSNSQLKIHQKIEQSTRKLKTFYNCIL